MTNTILLAIIVLLSVCVIILALSLHKVSRNNPENYSSDGIRVQSASLFLNDRLDSGPGYTHGVIEAKSTYVSESNDELHYIITFGNNLNQSDGNKRAWFRAHFPASYTEKINTNGWNRMISPTGKISVRYTTRYGSGGTHQFPLVIDETDWCRNHKYCTWLGGGWFPAQAGFFHFTFKEDKAYISSDRGSKCDSYAGEEYIERDCFQHMTSLELRFSVKGSK